MDIIFRFFDLCLGEHNIFVMSSTISVSKVKGRRKKALPRESLNPRILEDTELAAKVKLLYQEFRGADLTRFRNTDFVNAALMQAGITENDANIVYSLIGSPLKHDVVPKMNCKAAVETFKCIFKGASGYDDLLVIGGDDDPLLCKTTYAYLVDTVLQNKSREVSSITKKAEALHKSRQKAAIAFSKKMYGCPWKSKKQVELSDTERQVLMNSRNSKICKEVSKFGRQRWGNLGKRRERAWSFSMDSWIDSKPAPTDESEKESLNELHKHILTRFMHDDASEKFASNVLMTLYASIG